MSTNLLIIARLSFGGIYRWALPMLLALGCAACGGGGGYSGGGYNGSSASMPGYSSSSSSSSSSSASAASVSFSAQAQQVIPATNSTATATGNIAVDTTSGAATGSVTLAGVTPIAVTINDAFAGNNGTTVLTLTQSTTNAAMWNIAGTLSAPQLMDYNAGKLYLLVTSAAFTNGELRGQILPANVTVVWSSFSGTQVVPAVTSTITGTAAVTVNSATNKAAVNVNISANNAIGAELLTGSSQTNGTSLATLAADGAVAGHWLNENITVAATDVDNFNASKWYLNIYTAAHMTGEVRAQVAQTPPTLAQLQTDIFSARCAGCHSGTGTVLPGIQNLTSAANTYNNVVNVASIQQPALKRVKPFDPDNSYLIRKVEGNSSITGGRMPEGGPYLTTTQINQLRAWITAGAPNN